MTALAMIRGLIAYNNTLNERLWESIMTLTDEQFTQEVPYSHGSLRNHIVHAAGVDGRWIRGLQGQPDARAFQPDAADYPTRVAARQLWQPIAADMLAYVSALTEAELLAAAPDMDEPRWQILTHLANHGTDHRAQMLRLLHDLGAPTFDQDLIFYWWST